MPAYVPRKTVGGIKVCEGCQKWHARTAALHNPTGEIRGQHPQEWYHGSKHEFEDFGHSGGFHWNTLLGHHFSAQHEIAQQFSTTGDEDDEDDPAGHVVHAKLHIKNPKTYRSEHDMDQEVYEHERAQGNHIDKHLDKPDPFDPHDEYADDEDDFYDPEDDDLYNAKKYKGDSKTHYSKNDQDHGYYSGYRTFHPTATGWLNSHPDKDGIAARFKQRLKDQGHDGIVYGNDFEQNAHDKGGKTLDYYKHPVLDMPEVGQHNVHVPQHSVSAIPFENHQIEVTQHHYDGECKTPAEIADPRHMHVDDRLPPARGPYRQPRLPDTDVTRQPGTPKYKPVQHEVGEEPLTSYGAKKHTYTVQRYAPQGGYETVEKEIEGPLYHGGRAKLNEGDLITPGRKPNSWGDEGPKSTHVYFSTDKDTAASYSQQLGNKGHLYEVEPTGEFRTDYGPQDYKTPHPLRVVRKIPREEWQLGSTTAAHGEQSALNHAGQQDVYPVSTSRGITPMCQYHLNVHQSIAQGANDLAGHLGIPEASVERLGGSEKGTCAECFKNTDYQLKLNRPEGYDRQQQRDSKQPRTRKGGPYVPAKTKPLIVLRQSQNAKSVVSSSSDNGSVRASQGETNENGVIMGSNRRAPGQRLDHLRASEFVQVEPRFASEKPTFYYHGSHRDTEVSEDGRDETLHPAGGALHLHPDEGTAWKHAIKAWDKHSYGVDSFPRVYRVSHRDLPSDAQPTAGGGLTTHQPLTNPGRATYNPEKHPPIRGRYEEGPILYHGTSHHHDPEDYTLDQHEPLEEILPASRTGRGPTFASNIASPDHAYASKGLRSAWSYADTHAMETGGVPHVYRVTPHNPEDLEEDPKENEHGQSRGNNDDDMRSKSGFQVLGEVPMSRQLREYHTPERDEDDDDDWGDSHYGVKTAAWHNQDWDETDEETRDPDESFQDRRDRHVQHIADTHAIDRRRAAQVYDVVAEAVAKGKHLDPVKDIGFHHSELGRGGVSNQEWHEAEPEEIDLTKHKLHTSQGWVDPRGLAHKLFHPEGRYPDEAEHFVGDPDHDPDEGHHDDGWHDEDEDRPPSDYARVIHHKGTYHVVNGNHRLAVDLLTGQPKTWARVHHAADDDYDDPTRKEAMKHLPSLRQIVAHDATENQEIRHCPMCGGGKIIGRQDGSVECEYCHSYFTVQIQPQFPNFPQTIDGMPQQIPGMPGQVETPPGASVPGQEPAPGEEGAEDPAGGGNPFADGDADDAGGPPDGDADDTGGDEPPPFAKKSFKTVTGALLDEDTYARHLAIRFAPDRAAMIALIRQEQGAR